MPRYFSKRVKANDDEWYDREPFITSVTVCDHEATDTGLLDARGDGIWRAPRPVGFGRDDEW
jgi:hypothetical protein